MEQPPQLQMRRDDLAGLPPLTTPVGLTIRRAAEDDAAGIALCLATAFGIPWDATRVHNELLHHAEVLATFVAVCDGTVVATASAAHQPALYGDAGVLHWVAALPGQGGKGLGGLVSLAALHHCAGCGLVAAMLLTDDARVPAIRTYRKLGFRPFYSHRSHPARWQAILATLA
jgi:mycothiol synthase